MAIRPQHPAAGPSTTAGYLTQRENVNDSGAVGVQHSIPNNGFAQVEEVGCASRHSHTSQISPETLQCRKHTNTSLLERLQA